MTTTPKQPSLIPDIPREESEEAFRKFVEEVDLDEEDAAAIRERVASMSGEGEPAAD